MTIKKVSQITKILDIINTLRRWSNWFCKIMLRNSGYCTCTISKMEVHKLEIILSNSSHKPIYEQITSQIKAMIMSGELKPSDALPSMRALAKSLHISVITAQHAYEDLSRDGFIETVAGKEHLYQLKIKIF